MRLINPEGFPVDCDPDSILGRRVLELHARPGSIVICGGAAYRVVELTRRDRLTRIARKITRRRAVW